MESWLEWQLGTFPAVDEPRGGCQGLVGTEICSGDESLEMVYFYVGGAIGTGSHRLLCSADDEFRSFDSRSIAP